MYKILKKSLIWIGVLFFLVLIASQLKILMFNDISVEPISAEDNAEIKPGIAITRPPVYLISYASGNEIWFKNQNTLALSALNKGIDFILNYRSSHIDPDFFEKNKTIFNHKTGGGYWIWKPHLILKTMRNTPENAIIIYADTGSVFRGTLRPILDKMDHHDIVLYDWGDQLKKIASHYALAKTNCDTEECRKAPHVWAGFIVLRNTPTARAFIEKWLQYCEDEALVSGNTPLPPEDSAFTHHQHDEALLGITYHQSPKGILVLPPEEYPFLCWHHRRSGNEYQTLLPRMKKQITGIEQRFLNSSMIIKMRKFFLEKYFTNQPKTGPQQFFK